MENNMNNEIIGSGGKGGGSGRAAVEEPNTLRSAATVRVVEVISEGEIEGICGGGQGIYINDTPLEGTGGTINFNRVSWDYRVGLPSQDYMPGFPAVQAETIINAPIYENDGSGDPHKGVSHTTSTANIDAVKVTIQLPQGLMLSDSSNGDMLGTSVTIEIDTKLSSSGTWVSAGTFDINGKTMSAYERQYRIQRPAGSGTWDVRVKRITADSGVATLRNATTWSRFTEVQDIKLPYNDTAVVGIAIDAETVGNTIPTRSYLVKGLKVKVPSNYNPTTRVYTGYWDGTFNVLWTDNPAWVLYDILTHPRYGLGEFVSEAQVDKWAFYDAAVYNDGLVSNGAGGTEPRFTFNAVIASSSEALKMLQMVAGSFRAQLVYFNGLVTVIQDRPSSVQRLITKANVIDGMFNYKSSGLFERHTAFNVTYNDRKDRHLQRITTVDASTVPTIASTYTTMLSTAESRYGYNPADIAAYGAAYESQAIRQGLWAMDTELTQTEIAVWKMSINGFDLMPGTIVKVFDEDYTTTAGGGRVVSVTGTSVVLDRAVTLTTGSTIDVLLADGKTIETRNIVQTSGTLSTITISSAFSTAVIENGDFIVKTTVAARQFKIIAVKQDDKNTVSIEALLHDPNKYSRVESNLNLPTEIFSNAIQTTTPAPGALTFREASVNSDNTIKRSLLVSWTAPAKGAAAYYSLQYRRDSGTWENIPNIGSLAYELVNVPSGVYEVKVFAISGYGNQSPPSTGTYTINVTVGTGSSLNTPTGLQVIGGGTAFLSNSLAFQWTSPASVSTATLKDFEVKIINPSTSAVIRTDYVQAVPSSSIQTYIYSYDTNQADGGPRRSVAVEVRGRDTNYKTSGAAFATFTNVAPAIPSGIAVLGGLQSVKLTFTTPSDVDYKGVLVWGSTTTGFTPSSANLLYDGTDNYVSFSSLSDTTDYFYKIAAYDTFGKDYAGTGLNVSAQYTATTSSAPGINGGATLPLTGTEGKIFFNTTDGQLYRYHLGAWTSAVPSVNITGTLTDSQLAGISAAKIGGTITASQISSVNAAAVGAGLTAAQISSVNAASVGAGLTASQIASVNAAAVGAGLTGAQIAAATITGTNIVGGTITGAKIAAGTVSASNLIAGTITANEIAGLTITGAQLSAGAVTAGKITAGAITSGDIAALTITGANIAAGTLSAGKFTAGAIVAGDIAAGTITSTNIAAGTITGSNIAAGTITASNITANSITAGQIAAYTITSSQIATGTITAGNLVANTITGDKIAVGAITATNIAGATITATQIAVGTITGGLIAANTINASNITSGTITGTQIAANSITASNIDTRGLSIKDAGGTVIFASGTPLTSAYITPSSGWLNSSISISATGVLYGGGGGQITTLPTSDTRTTNAAPGSYAVGVTSEFKQAASIGAPSTETYGNLKTESSWTDASGGAITQTFKALDGEWKRTNTSGSYASWNAWTRIVDRQITSSNASTFIADLAVNTLQIAGNAITIPSSAYSVGQVSASPELVVQGLAITSTGAPALIGFSTYYYTDRYEDAYIKLTRRPTYGGASTVIFQVGPGGGNNPWALRALGGMQSGSVQDTPGAGAFTYELICGSSSGYTVYCASRSISYLEVKK